MAERNNTRSIRTPNQVDGPRLADDLDTSGGQINNHIDTDNAFSIAGLENARASREALNKSNESK